MTTKNKTQGTKKESSEVNESNTKKKGSAPIVVDLENKLVKKKGVEKDVNGRSYELTVTLDLSGLNETELLIAAAEHLHIRWIRKQLLNVSKDLGSLQGKTLDVSQYRPERKQKDNKSKAYSSVKKFADEQGISFEKALEIIKEESE